MTRIICIGNRFAYPDNFGILIYEQLKEMQINDVEVVEGGVGGDSLALYFEDDAKILLVDYATDEMPKIITHNDIETLEIEGYSHATALLYLLKMMHKEYTLYLCSDLFDEDTLEVYLNDILTLARSL